MKKIAISYKGIFNINHIKNKGVNLELLNSFKLTIKNHKQNIFNYLSESNVLDFFISTYNVDNELNKLFLENYNVKQLSFLPSSYMDVYSNISQILHHKKIVSMIKEEEIKNNFFYDLVMITRPDIFFYKDYNSISLILESFNITIEHESKNCDDNFWVFPRVYLDLFEESLESLLREDKITHEINHELKKRQVPIHYIEPLFDGPYEQHLLFKFVR